MATTDSGPSIASGRRLSRKQKWLAGIIILLLIAILVLIANFGSMQGNAQAGAGYASHIVCSCRYVQGRDMASCETDLEESMEAISLSDDPENKRVTASVPFLAQETAEKRGDYGCVILNEEESEAAG